MAAENRTEADAVTDEPSGPRPLDAVLAALSQEGERFEFSQVVRLLTSAQRDRLAPGRGRDPAKEAITFRSWVGLGFPPSDVRSVVPSSEPNGPPTVTVNFLGLASPGTRTALPNWYATELLAQERAPGGEPVLRDFLDLFNHRLIGLFYRAWERNNLPVQYESGAHSPMTEILYAMIGLGSPSQRNRLAVDDRVLLRFADKLARRPVSADALWRILTEYFGDEFDIIEFVPHYDRLPSSDRLTLGGERFQLGLDTVLGERAAAAQSSFRLRIGPLDWQTFSEYLPPDGARFHQLRDLVRFAVGPEFDFDAQLVLRAPEVPKLVLGDWGIGRLGWSTWLGARLGTRETTGHAENTIVPVSELERAVSR